MEAFAIDEEKDTSEKIHRNQYNSDVASVSTTTTIMDHIEEQRSNVPSGSNEAGEHTITEADSLQNRGDEPGNSGYEQSSEETITANLMRLETTDKPLGHHIGHDDAVTDAESVTPIHESSNALAYVGAETILYAREINVKNNLDDSDKVSMQSKPGLMAERAQSLEENTEQITHFESDEEDTELRNVGSEFTTLRDTHLKEITDFNKEIKEFEERIKEDCHKLEEETKTLIEKMSKLQQDRDVLDKTIIDNEMRWTSVMRTDKREQAEAKLSEQKRLLDSLKGERNFRSDRWKEFMKEVQRAKEKEVKDLKHKLDEYDRLLRHFASEHVDDIAKIERTLTLEIAALEKEKEMLAKERDLLKNSGDNSVLRDRILYLNAEIQKRDDYILIQEDRLRKAREAAALFNDLNARDYDKYRQFRNWQEVDGQLNERSAEIKQSFRQRDDQSLVDTLTWVQTTIERIPGNCIHGNDFQRMAAIIQNAIRGDYSGIRTNIAFQQEPNCVLQ